MRKNVKYKLSIYLLSFMIPIIIMVLVLLYNGIYPFGIKDFAIWDMDLQYLDFFSWLRRVFQGEGNLFYSFSKSLGDNTFGLYAYYLSSPFHLLLFFMDDLQLFVVIITVLKLATCGLTCSIFLTARFRNIHGVWIVLLSSSYALMDYGLHQSSNTMWLDGMYMLPIMLLGVHLMVYKGKRHCLFVSVMLAVIFNWYTTYMCCIFVSIFFIYELIRKHQFQFSNIIKNYLLPVLQFGITMLLSLGTSMFFFLPVIFNLLQGKGAIESDLFISEFRCSIGDVLLSLIPGMYPTGNNSVLILYCGSITSICLLLFICSRKVDLKTKLSGILLLSLLVFTSIYIPTENIWNGFRRVFAYYCRYTFIICFFMIYLSAVYLNKSRKCGKKIMFVCSVCVLLELGINASIVMGRLALNDTNKYHSYVHGQKQLIETIRNKEEASFYRMDQTKSRGTRTGNYGGTYNEGMALGYSPLATYSSAYNGRIMQFYIKSGYSNRDHLIMYHEPILPVDSLIGIKYVLSDRNIDGLTRLDEFGIKNDKKVFYNPHAMELGFKVEDTIFKGIESRTSFEYQNELWSNILGEKVELLKQIEAVQEKSRENYTWTMKTPGEQNILYGYLKPTWDVDIDVFINGEFRTKYLSWYAYQNYQLPSGGQDNSSKLSIEGSAEDLEKMDAVFYYLDLQLFRKCIEKLKENQFNTEVFKDGYVSGYYDADEEGLLLLTIPYDEGWSITCNNKKIDADIAADLFTVIPVEKGYNQIEMKYIPPGFQLGIKISILCFSVYMLWCLWEYRENFIRSMAKC